MLKLTLKENSIILPVQMKMVQIYCKCYRNVGFFKYLEVSDEAIRVERGGLYYEVEIPDTLFFLLNYLVDKNTTNLFNELYTNYESLDDETMEYYDKHIQDLFFQNEIITNLNNSNSIKPLFISEEEIGHNYGNQSLASIDTYLKKNILKGNDKIVNQLLYYRTANYSENSIQKFYEYKEKVKLGEELPTIYDLYQDWSFMKDDCEIDLLGYRGSFDQEMVKIPKMLNDGTIIRSIAFIPLDPDRDEYLSLELIDVGNKLPDFEKDGILNVFRSSLLTKIPYDYEGYDPIFASRFISKLFASRF